MSILRDNNKELILINVKNHAMGVWKFFMFKENGSSHLNIPSLKRYAQIFAMEMQRITAKSIFSNLAAVQNVKSALKIETH